MAGRLGGGREILIPDHPGHGDSPVSASTLSHTAWLGALQALHDAHGADRRLTLVGHDLGAWLAIRYTLDHPGAVERVVLASPVGIDPLPDADLMLPRDLDGLARWTAYLDPSASPPAAVAEADAALARYARPGLASLHRSLDGQHLDEALADVLVPLEVLWSTDDRLFSEADALRLANRPPPRAASRPSAPVATTCSPCAPAPWPRPWTPPCPDPDRRRPAPFRAWW